jgi:GntR family transcriptional regulator, transcriptional repressor for pyruvate dehydrogenase complex
MMLSFKPIKSLRVSEGVAEQLKQSVVLGHIRTGDRLPTEQELSEQFQVGRVAIREAMRILENKGFITIRPGAKGGAFVREITFDHLTDAYLDLYMAQKFSILEAFRVRVLVEPEVARLAAQRITPEYAQRLRDAVDAEFHLVLAEMCGNRFLETLMRSTIGLGINVVQAVGAANEPLHEPEKHYPVMEAVLAGDPEAAAEAMKKHTLETGDELMKIEKIYWEKRRVNSQGNEGETPQNKQLLR